MRTSRRSWCDGVEGNRVVGVKFIFVGLEQPHCIHLLLFFFFFWIAHIVRFGKVSNARTGRFGMVVREEGDGRSRGRCHHL